MSETVGHSTPASLGRRVVCDFLDAGMRMPLAAIQKNMDLSEVAAARQMGNPRPSWCGIFTKAYAKVVASRPDLRQAFLTFPWERIYHEPTTTADVVVESRLGDENVIVTVRLTHPESRPLAEIDQDLAVCREDPVKRVRRFRRALWLARFPRFVRRRVWWYLLNASGRRRFRYFGAFGVTSVGNWGVDSLRPIAPWTSLLHYGAMDARGLITMRLTYDHRVLDGSGPSTALVELERVLKTEIVAELKSLQASDNPQPLPKAG